MPGKSDVLQGTLDLIVLMIRFTGDHAALVRDVRRLVWEVKPALPLHWNELSGDLIARRHRQPRAPRARRDPCACG